MTIDEILNVSERSIDDIIADLTDKQIVVPSWGKLKEEYDPTLHPVMNKANYQDIPQDDGKLERVTRITYDLQRLAVKRMNELVYGIPVKRIWSPENDRQKQISTYIENIFTRTRMDSVNLERGTMLFAGCEVMTLWYAIKEQNNAYGFDSALKLRCRNFSPMNGDALYPYFDEDGDLVALSVMYTRKVMKDTVTFFDVYTAAKHYQFSKSTSVESATWEQKADEDISINGKIPAVYAYRPTPIWEDTSKIVYEMEWAMSRTGNYIRKNSKPIFGIFADEVVSLGTEKQGEGESRSIVQFPAGTTAQYITWPQQTDSLRFFMAEMRQTFFTQLQLPDWSYESMKATPMSGEARKQLFIDCQLKVKDESGRLLEMHDREVNVVKAFLKVMLPDDWASDVDALQFECEITPFMISEDKEQITNLMTANGGKPLMSQRESIEQLGWSKDVDKTVNEIAEETKEANAMMADLMA